MRLLVAGDRNPRTIELAGRLMRGQSIILRGRETPLSGKVYATCNGVLVAVGDVERGELVPRTQEEALALAHRGG